MRQKLCRAPRLRRGGRRRKREMARAPDEVGCVPSASPLAHLIRKHRPELRWPRPANTFEAGAVGGLLGFHLGHGFLVVRQFRLGSDWLAEASIWMPKRNWNSGGTPRG